MIPIRTAKHVVLLWMKLSGFAGITMPWAIYIHPHRLHDWKLIAHERVHEQQIERDGALRFFTRYLWWSLRYGYRDNPYEVEARRGASATVAPANGDV